MKGMRFMIKINKYLRKEVKNGSILITEDEKLIVEKLVEFYFNGTLNDDIEELDLQRKQVKLVMDVSFYKEVGREIDKIKIAKTLKMKQKTINIIQILLSNDIKTFSELSDVSKLSIPELKQILHNKSLISEYEENIFIALGEKLSVLDASEKENLKYKTQELKKEKDKLIKLKLYDEFIWEYLRSRKRYCDMKGFSWEFLRTMRANIISDEYRENYPVDIIEKLNIKSNELKSCKATGKNLVIRDRKIIEIVKPEINKVSPFILSKLELVVMFFENFGNIERMTASNDFLPSYNSVLSSMLLPELKDYLTSDAYTKLTRYLTVEKTYQTLNYTSRLDMVLDVFCKYSGNIYSIINDNDNEELVLRILSDKLVKKIAGDELYNKVLEKLDDYNSKRYVIGELLDAKVNVKKLND